MVTKWMGDRYSLGLAPAPKFLRGRILCILYKSPSDETTNRGVGPCVYTHSKRSHTYVNDPVVHVRFRWIVETELTQHAQKDQMNAYGYEMVHGCMVYTVRSPRWQQIYVVSAVSKPITTGFVPIPLPRIFKTRPINQHWFIESLATV